MTGDKLRCGVKLTSLLNSNVTIPDNKNSFPKDDSRRCQFRLCICSELFPEDNSKRKVLKMLQIENK